MTPLPRQPFIVTGGGQGLGRAFCRALAKAGALAVVADLDVRKAESVVADIVASGGRACAAEVDVSDASSVDSMVAMVGEQHGPPVGLVNNAAIFSTLALQPFTDIDVEVWNRVLAVNVTGAFLCARAVVPLMAASGYGKIVNISSATVWTGRAGYLHYVTSKAALIGMTRALAAEVGPLGVRVNAVTPGSTKTEIERETISVGAREAMAAQTALRRVQTPEDLVGAVVFLSSPASDFITGQTLNVDGGFAFH